MSNPVCFRLILLTRNAWLVYQIDPDLLYSNKTKLNSPAELKETQIFSNTVPGGTRYILRRGGAARPLKQ